MKNRGKVYRAMQDLTQVALARDLGATRQTILAMEKGKYDPSLIPRLQDRAIIRGEDRGCLCP
jgi:DNA-binding XRE family transcriptional regulator